LAWNIGVASGTTCNAAMALGIDDFSLKCELPKIPASQHYIFVNDMTGWDALGLYAWGDSELFGAWPGEASVGDSIVGGANWKVFLLNTDGGSYNLIFNNWNNGLQLPDYSIVANCDYFFTITSSEVTETTATLIESVFNETPAFDMKGSLVSFPGVITVYNINGQAVASGDKNLDIQHLDRGIYIMQGRSDKQTITIKIAKGE
jgi:hypothetical protein